MVGNLIFVDNKSLASAQRPVFSMYKITFGLVLKTGYLRFISFMTVKYACVLLMDELDHLTMIRKEVSLFF